MKFFPLLVLSLCVCSLKAQVKDYQVKENNKTKQIEYLQQIKLVVDRKIDTLQTQLPRLLTSLDMYRKKIDQLKKENDGLSRSAGTEAASRQFAALVTATNEAGSIRKKFDARLAELDKAMVLQKDLEDKIAALLKENDR